MMTFTSSADLSRLQNNPAHPVISKLVHGLTQPVTVALMEPHDIDHPLTQLSNAEDVTLEGIIERESMFLVALETDYEFGIVLVVPKADWLSNELYQCIKDNLYH